MLFNTKTFIKRLRKPGTPFHQIRLRIKKRLGWLGIPVIEPFTGFSNGREVFIAGNVMEDKGLEKPEAGHKPRANMLAMFKRYVSDEIGGVRIKIKFRDLMDVVESNDLGLFHCRLKLEHPLPDGVYFEKASFELLDKVVENQSSIIAEGRVMVVSGNHSYGVISDIDDTVMVSHSTQILKKLRLMLFKNARTRIPFEGVSAFYRALYKGKGEEHFPNPMFYVSSSEWNIYDLLTDFMEYRSIPSGPLLLRERKHNIFKFWKWSRGNHDHKLEKIRFLFSFFPRLDFILIGDSGQQDPDIYWRIVNEFPNRVKAVYIRCVGKTGNISSTRRTALAMKEKNVPVLLIDNTEEAVRHAISSGFIDEASIPDISRQLRKDHQTSGLFSPE